LVSITQLYRNAYYKERTPPTCFNDKSPSSGRRQYKGIYNINTSISNVQC